MPTAIQDGPSTMGLRSVILEEANEPVARALWRHIAGDNGAKWKERIGRLGVGHDRFDAMVEAWAGGLVQELDHPDHRADASAILARLYEQAAEVTCNRTIYRHLAPGLHRHRYWPTGEPDHPDRDNLFTMSFCPKRHPIISRETKVASAGSCFAQRIGDALKQWGYNYFITEPGPTELSETQRQSLHYGEFSARYGTIFNAPSLRQLVERGIGLIELEPYLWESTRGWYDPYREGIVFAGPDDHAADLPVFLAALRRTLLEVDVFVITLGVNEVWYFKHDGSYLSRVPWHLSPALLGKKVLSVEENLAHLQRMRDVWTMHNSNLELIVTVSPVPLLATFRSDEMNVVVANCHSKSTLRVAAEAFAGGNDNVTYFPAYEAVLYGSRQPFVDDGRHVHPDAVERVMTMFHDTFFAE